MSVWQELQALADRALANGQQNGVRIELGLTAEGLTIRGARATETGTLRAGAIVSFSTLEAEPGRAIVVVNELIPDRVAGRQSYGSL